MSKKSLSLLLVLIVALLSFGVVVAQDATQQATAGANEFTVGDLVANKDQYYGQTVTTEGTIEDLVNIRAFVLGDGAALGDNQILVINNSNENFDLAIKNDQRVRLTGTLYRDFNSGGWSQLAGPDGVNGPSPTQQASADAGAGTTGNTNTTGSSDTTGSGAAGTSGDTTGNGGDTTGASGISAAGGVDQTGSGVNGTTVQGTPGENEGSASQTGADQAGASGATSPNPSGAAATLQATPNMMATQDMSMSMGSGAVDLSQMYIPEALRSHTILVLTSLDSITYIQDQ
jgi:hypothetical protein